MTDQVAKPDLQPSRLEMTEQGSGPDRRSSLSERRYLSLIGAMAAIVWTVTPAGEQIEGTPEWEAFTGQTQEEVSGFGWVEAIHPEDRDRTLRIWRKAAATGDTYEVEHRLRRNDGVYRLMQVRGVPVRDASGEIVEWVGMHTDVTEQRNLEAALQRREMELREAHRIAHLGSWWWDVDTDTVSWSDVVYQIFERDPGLAAPHYEELARYHTEESWALLNSAVGQALAVGQSYELDLEIDLKDGRRKWIAARGEVESYRDGRVSRLRGTIQDISERKKRLQEAQAAEAAARESEERLRVAARAAMFGTFDSDLVQGTMYWSPEMRELLGFPAEAATSARVGVPSFVHPEDAEQVGQSLQAAMQSEDGQLVNEHRILRPDGAVRWMQLRGQVRFEGEGQDRHPVRFSGTIFDITERKMAENALRKSEERFRKLFESDLLGIGTPHVLGGFEEVNEEFLRIVGYSRADFDAGLVRWDKMTPPEYAGIDRARIEEAVGRGSCTPYEKEYIRKDGSRVPILCGYASLGSSPDHFIGFIQDLSRQKQTEEAIRDREQRFSVLAESLPSLIFVTEQNGSFSYCNGRFLEYAGHSGEGLTSIRWENLIHAEDLMPTAEVWRRCMESADPFLKEHRLRRHDGVYRWFLSRAMPVRDEQGQVVRWFGSSTEIHEQKLAEQALRRSDKLAAMGRLAASVAHEINNPLTSVTNALYLARIDPMLSETTRGFLELADQELARVAQVATQTLRFYKQSTAPSVTDVSQVLEQVVTIFAARLRSLSVEVVREYGADCQLHCFGDELRQVFANLIGNALDAMTEGGRLRIRVRRAGSWKEERRSGVRVLVGDSGSGVPVEVLQQIFEPFVSTKVDTGTGLGLWVSDGIVRKHGGYIRVRTASGAGRHGSVFSVFFPLDGVMGGEQGS